jgi:hypothetical protein
MAKRRAAKSESGMWRQPQWQWRNVIEVAHLYHESYSMAEMSVKYQ